MLKRLNPVLLLAAMALTGCNSLRAPQISRFSHFVGISDFSTFSRTKNPNGETVLLSPEIQSPIAWNELIVSWNAKAPPGTFLKIEAAAISTGHHARFYTMGIWSLDNEAVVRTSVRGQKDADGTVDEDTLVLNGVAYAAQIRVTLGGTNGVSPALKFIGISFSNTKVPPANRPPNRRAWGKAISTPERSQHGYPDENGWCSPTSLSMVLARWAKILRRPEMNLPVPEVAAKVYDRAFGATGDWPFNTAFAGSFQSMRAYVTRFDDISEVEDWIAAGIPVILSARWDWLKPGRPLDATGHLIVCIGFTKTGDVIINDPATRFDRGETVRRVYKRADVIHAWSKSHHAVYLVYPVGWKIPPNRFDQ